MARSKPTKARSPRQQRRLEKIKEKKRIERLIRGRSPYDDGKNDNLARWRIK